MRGPGLLASLAAAVAFVVTVGLVVSSPTIAVVDGTPITRTDYDRYAHVFTNPAGDLVVSREEVLLSIVNQVIVEREAARRGIAVTDSDVGDAIANMEQSEALLPPGINEPGFRERLRMFMLFREVKEAIVGQVEIPLASVQAEFSRDPALREIGLEEATPVLTERLIGRESDRRWVEWLDKERVCVDIHIFDVSFHIPSSTPSPKCPSEVDN